MMTSEEFKLVLAILIPLILVVTGLTWWYISAGLSAIGERYSGRLLFLEEKDRAEALLEEAKKLKIDIGYFYWMYAGETPCISTMDKDYTLDEFQRRVLAPEYKARAEECCKEKENKLKDIPQPPLEELYDIDDTPPPPSLFPIEKYLRIISKQKKKPATRKQKKKRPRRASRQ